MKKQALISIIAIIALFKTISGASFWFKIPPPSVSGSYSIQIMTVTGPKFEYLVLAGTANAKVGTIDWDANTYTTVKEVQLPTPDASNTGSFYNPFLGSDKSKNVIYYGPKVSRFNSIPGSPPNIEEYPFPGSPTTPHNGDTAYFGTPEWTRGTAYIMVTRNLGGASKLYRMLTGSITDLRTFPLTSFTNAYGIVGNTTWLLASLANTNKRQLYDYTNGYEGGADTTIMTHLKTSEKNEVGFVSPEDGRGYYVVSAGETKTIKTVKVVTGVEKLHFALTGFSTSLKSLSWIVDTDFVLVSDYRTKFAIVNFMDDSRPAPTYTTIQEQKKMGKKAFVWEYRKVLGFSTTDGHIHFYKLLDEAPCSGLCQTCEETMKKKCSTCKPNSSPVAGLQNSCSCNSGFYMARVSYTTKQCIACSASCATCSGGFETDCLSCVDQNKDLKADGSCGCKTGKYLSGEECLDCHTSCQTCSGPGATACLACNERLGKYLSGTSCLNCDSTCKTCSGAGPNSCVSCDEANSWQLQGTKCKKICPKTNQFVDPQYICKDCPEFCSKCQDNTGTCTACESGFTLQSSGLCKRDCQAKEFWKEDNTCASCIENCAVCEDISGTCTKCDKDYVYVTEKKICEKAAKPLRLTKVYYSELNTRLEISFNQAIITKELKTSLNVKMRDSAAPTNDFELTSHVFKMDNTKTRIFVEIDFEKEGKSFEKYNIEVTEIVAGAIKSELDPRLVHEKYPIV